MSGNDAPQTGGVPPSPDARAAAAVYVALPGPGRGEAPPGKARRDFLALFGRTLPDDFVVAVHELEQAEEQRARKSSWSPVDLTAVLDGSYSPPEPTVGARSDGVGLFYPGRMHTVSGETEAAKSWLLLLTSVQEIAQGNHVVYIDPEDDEAGVVGRLTLLGADPAHILERFHYIRPEEALDAVSGFLLDELLGDVKPTFSVIDGVTEAMVMHGLNPLDNADCAKFGRTLPRRLTRCGAACVAADHVTKSSDGRGRYSIGAVHKLNGLNGAAYTLENRVPFGVGRTGRSGVFLAKDRPGQLRRHALPTKTPGMEGFGDFVMESLEGGLYNEAAIYPAVEKADRDQETRRPTKTMIAVSNTLAANPKGLSKNGIEGCTSGRATVIRAALELLVNEGYVHRERDGSAYVHTLIRPFEGAESDR